MQASKRALCAHKFFKQFVVLTQWLFSVPFLARELAEPAPKATLFAAVELQNTVCLTHHTFSVGNTTTTLPIMSLINVENVEVLDNPSKFTTPFNFLITFECIAPGIKEGDFFASVLL